MAKVVTLAGGRNTMDPLSIEAAKARKPLDRLWPEADVFALGDILEHLGIKLAYNTALQRTEIYRTDRWKPLQDEEEGALREVIATVGRIRSGSGSRQLRFSKQGWADALSLYGQWSRRDPPSDWLESLDDSMSIEDAESAMFSVFEGNLGIHDTPINRWVSRAIWLGVLERIKTPGSGYDIMPVLVGGQGDGKSLFIKEMLPKDIFRSHPDSLYFLEDFDFSKDKVERVTEMMGKVLVECPECQGLTTANVKAVKAFLGPGVDTVRLKYNRRAVSVPRTAYLIGTANESRPLPNDPTGLRRFVVVKTERGRSAEQIQTSLDEHREEVWCAAKALLKAGYTGSYLPVGLRQAQADINRDRESFDGGSLSTQLRTLEPWHEVPLSQNEIMFRLGYEPGEVDKIMLASVKRALLEAGFTRKSIYIAREEKSKNGWLHPQGLYGKDYVRRLN
ncbi:MAG: hypothetical protein OXD46_13050 [Chloroflexi bacterium]|nr:hypothetical protein [Chloroflexota bacterium]